MVDKNILNWYVFFFPFKLMLDTQWSGDVIWTSSAVPLCKILQNHQLGRWRKDKWNWTSKKPGNSLKPMAEKAPRASLHSRQGPGVQVSLRFFDSSLKYGHCGYDGDWSLSHCPLKWEIKINCDSELV